jgi:hypothetical protein
MAFIGAKRKPLTEGADGSGASLAKKGLGGISSKRREELPKVVKTMKTLTYRI